MDLQDLHRLLEVNKIINSTLDLEELLTIIVEKASELAKAEAGSLILIDPQTQELVFNIALGQHGEQLKQIRLKPWEGIAGWVAQEGKTLIVNDAENDPRWSARVDTRTAFRTQSILCVPLIIKERIIGVMEVINKKENNFFNEDDQHIMEALAAQAAVAMENARLFKEVKEKKEQIETVFKGMTDGAVLTDAEYLIIMANEAALRFLNVKSAEAVGRNVLEFLQKEFRFSLGLKQIRGASISFEMKRKAGKNFFLQNVTTKLVDEQNNISGYIVLLRDISELRKEDILKQNFISLISHKLKTPLTSIIGFTSLLQMNNGTVPSSELLHNALAVITAQSKALNTLVSELITFTMLETEAMEIVPAEIDSILLGKELEEHFKTKLGTSAGSFSLEDSWREVPSFFADENKIREVFKHLIDNAIRFNNKENKNVTLAAAQLSPFEYRFAVADNGPGIPPEEQEKIFQKFYQIEESFTGQVEGAGLGLALVKKIVESHGGKIWVESKIGEGSTFIFTILKKEII